MPISKSPARGQRIAVGQKDPAAVSLWEHEGSTYDVYSAESGPAAVPTPPRVSAATSADGPGARNTRGDEVLLSGETYRVYRARWHMLGIFCLLTFTNAFLWIGFAPIAALAQRYYHVGSAHDFTYVNLLSVIFMFLYPPGSYLAMFLITKHGLRYSISLGAALMAVGGWIRYASTWAAATSAAKGAEPSVWGYVLVLAGQSLPALAQPLFTNVPAKLAGDWFPQSERDIATVIGSLFNPLGNAAGQVIPTLLVSCIVTASTAATTADMMATAATATPSAAPSPNGTAYNGTCPSAHDVDGMETLLLVQAVLATAACVWAVGWFREDPPSPPSRSAADRLRARKAYEMSPPSLRLSATSTIRNHFVALTRNREFLKLLFGFGLGLAVFNALLTVLTQLVLPLYGDTSVDINNATNDAGIYGGVLIGAGMVGAAVVGPILDCTHAYRAFLKGLFTLSTLGLVFVLTQLRPDNETLITVGFGVMGLSMMPLLPTALESAVECTYPVPEEMSGTLLMMVGNVAGLGFTYAMQYLIELRPKYDPAEGPWTPASVLLVSMVGASTLVVYMFQGEYLRLEADRNAERDLDDSLLEDDIARGSGRGYGSAAGERGVGDGEAWDGVHHSFSA